MPSNAAEDKAGHNFLSVNALLAFNLYAQPAFSLLSIQISLFFRSLSLCEVDSLSCFSCHLLSQISVSLFVFLAASHCFFVSDCLSL